MRNLGIEWIRVLGRIWIDGYFRLTNQTENETTPDGEVHLYAKGDSIYKKSDDQIEVEILTTSSSSTDEEAQDAVGSILVDSSSINFTYTDATPEITAVVLPAGVDHGGLAGLSDDDHPQYQKETDFTDGSILFRGATVIAQDNAELFWDDTNNRLNIGDSTPVIAGKLNVHNTNASIDDVVWENATVQLGAFGHTATDNGLVSLFAAGVEKLRMTATAPIFNTIGGSLNINAPAINTVPASAGRVEINTTAGSEVALAFRQTGATNYGFDWKLNANGDLDLIRVVAGSSTVLATMRQAEGIIGIGTSAAPTTGTMGLIFGDGTALATMASNTAGFYGNDVGGTVNMFAINEAGVVTQLSGVSGTYTPTNVTEDRSYDANATDTAELADVLGTLIADLQTRGVLA